MALAQVTIMANQVESARIGHQAISLTEFASNLEPEIAAGSVVEVGGALYEAAADEAIAGLAAIAPSSDVYIKLTVAGASVTASGTIVAPTWSDSKAGWYIGAERVIGGLYKDAGGNYTEKYLLAGWNEKTVGTGKIRNAAVATAKIADLAVTVAKLAANAVTDAKIDKTLGTTGSQAIGAGGTWTPAAGVYVIVAESGVSCYLEVFSGAWRRGTTTGWSGTLITDGVNVRLYSAAGVTVYWRKLS